MTLEDALGQIGQALGSDRVLVDVENRYKYSTDRWPLALKWAQLGRRPFLPDAIVRVANSSEVATVLNVARANTVVVTARGLGSSVTGQPLATNGGIILDLSLLVGDVQVDDIDLVVTTGAGRCGEDLESQLRLKGLTLGHVPQSLGLSSVGGWVSTLASGQFSTRYGGIEDLLIGLKGVLADGTNFAISRLPRSAMGPDLRGLFLGAEGTLGVVTEVSLKVFRAPTCRKVEAFILPSVEQGLEALRQTAQAGLRPFVIRLYDAPESQVLFPGEAPGTCMLLTGCEGEVEVATAERSVLSAIVLGSGGISVGQGPVEAWLERRFDFSAIEEHLATQGGYTETIEVAHRWSKILELYRALTADLLAHGVQVLSHFSHVYQQGTSLYVIVFGEAPDATGAASQLEAIWATAMTTTLRLGGVLSHHHGPGLARGPHLPEALQESMPMLQGIKRALDPRGILNPGKLGLRLPLTERVPGDT